MIPTDIRTNFKKELLSNHIKEVSEINAIIKEFNDYLISEGDKALSKEEREFIEKYPNLVIKQPEGDIRYFLHEDLIGKQEGSISYWENFSPIDLTLKFPPDTPKFFGSSNDLMKNFPSVITEEWKDKLKKVYHLLINFRKKKQIINEIIDAPEITMTNIKENSPKLYEIYEKVRKRP